MTILVVAAHPDDEVLGCGGTIARRVAEDYAVHVLIMAEGAMSRGADWRQYKDQLKERADHVQAILGIKSYSFADFPDNAMDKVAMLELAKCIEKHVELTKPSAVFTHWRGDLNIDHKLTFQAVMTACRPQPGAPVKGILSFEVPSATGWDYSQFRPNCYVNISGAFWAKKMGALDHYREEMREFPHARSVEGVTSLANYRGSMVGLSMAEGFEIVRVVQP